MFAARDPRRPAVDRWLLALGALVLASTIVRFVLSRGVDAPWIAPDEQLYGLLGRSLVGGDGLRILGAGVPYYSFLYPLLVGIGLSAGVMAVQGLQALLMSAAAIPVYLWARPVAGPRWALLAAGLSVLIPGLAYSGLFMSEALYYPMATLAAWALAVCIQRPTVARQALLLAAVGLALATRLQAAGFGAAILVALALLALAERSTAPFRRLLPTLGVLGLVAVAWVGTRVVLGGAGELLGAYAPLAGAGEYSAGDVAQSIAWETGALSLLTIGIPLVATLVLGWGTLQGREADPRVRALVATALAYALVTVVEVGAFASRFVEHVTERQLLSVAPPLFVAFAVWLHRGLPRPQPVTSLVTLAVAASTLLLPLDRVTVPAVYADAPSLIPLERLSHYLAERSLEAVYSGVAALVLLLAVALPRRLAAPAVAAVVALSLAGASVIASTHMRDRSQVERERTFAGVAPDWIDRSGARDVTLLLSADRFWPSSWETLFWNRSIARVVRLRGTQDPGVMPQRVAALRADGALVTRSGAVVGAPYVAASTSIAVVGARVAEVPTSPDQRGMALWKAEPPLRISHEVVGFRPNGDVQKGDRPVVKVFDCGAGRLELTLLGKEGKPTRVLVGGKVVAERAIPSGKVWRPSIPAPPTAAGSAVCRFRLETDGLIGSTRIDFVRG